jgi:predicted acetyltransferase
MEIRPVTEEEMEAFLAVPDYVFASNDSDEVRAQRPVLMRPDWTLGGFVDGRLSTSFAAWPFRVRLNGATTRMAGVTMVGTYPEFRRQGILRAIMVKALETYRDAGRPFAILWASMAAIYQRFGYGLASTSCRYDIEPRHISFQWGDPAPGRVQVRPVAESRPVLEALYGEFNAPRNLMIDRAPGMWEGRLWPPDGGRLHAGIYHDPSGVPTGYLVFSFRVEARADPGPDQVMTVHDWAALDAEAHLGLWEFCAAHDLAHRVVWSSVPEDDPMPLLLQEPRQLRRRTGDGLWMRITDVAAALTQRPYGDAGAVILAVHDQLCPWNEGTFVLETNGAESHAERIDSGPTTGADLEFDIHALAPLITGHSTATALARSRLIAARDVKALAVADRVFAPDYRPWCPDGF